MALKIKFDNTHNAIEPTLVLATRKGIKIGKIPAHSIVIKDGLNISSELNFKVNKTDLSNNDLFWTQLTDFKLLWVREWNKWFEIYVEIDEENDTVKNVSAVSLGEAELSQINLYGIEINTETDISRDDYEPTVLYKSNNPSASLLSRIMEKAPHYTVKHVDASIANIQRTFTFDNKSLYDVFQEISEEIDCLFLIDCYSDSEGNIIREINVYDLESNCLSCGERGEFSDVCPKCGSSDILTGYGEDTTIFVSTDNLADGITYTTNNGSVKNCFKLEAGDDLMTATLVNCNPNGSAYIWYISDAVKEDMSPELVKKLNKYNEDYTYYQNTYPASISGSVLNAYNKLIQKYKVYTDDYNEIRSPIIGYSALMEVYYNTIDYYLFLNNSLMPSVKISKTNATKEAAKLNSSSLSPVAVRDLDICSNATADSSVLGMAKTIINGRYKVQISESSFSENTWTGSFTVTSYSDEEDTAATSQITIKINDNYSEYVQQKIKKALRQSVTEDEITDVVKLFGLSDSAFISELKKYSLSRLTAFHDNCQSCIDVLMEQGIANNQTWANSNPNLYESLYIPYYNKLGYIEEEIKVREDEIAIVIGKLDSNGNVVEDGIQTLLDVERNKIHKNLDFEKYVGSDLWLEFSAYRREDTYKNDNYISDGLNNAELFENAREFLKIAQKDIYKSATLQHSISATLKNLLTMKEFEPIVDYFKVGNWLRIKVDKNIYRLRLLEYEIDFDNLNNLSISFSDVTDTSTGKIDIESVLGQAASISSTYDSTRRKAQKGDTSKNWLDNWVDKGLDATNVKIVSNADNQTQVWDRHGILLREYDEFTDTYSDEQSKIINSTYVMTNDGWKTVKTAFGKYYYYDPRDNFKLKTAYGIIGETIVGKVILGEQLGIFTSNGSMSFTEDNGLVVTNGVNNFSVNPNSNSILTISHNGEDLLNFDEKGQLHISGDGAALDINANDNITGLHSRITQTAEEIRSEVSDKDEKLRSLISQTAIEIRSDVEDAEKDLYSEISQTAGEIRTEIKKVSEGLSSRIDQTDSEIAAEVKRATDKEGELSSSIKLTADRITSTVASSQNKYDTSKFPYTITLFGYYDPNDTTNGISAADNNGKYYLNQSNGYVYKSDGKKWDVAQEKVNGENAPNPLPLISATMYSEIIQTADAIRSKVASGQSKYDTSILPKDVQDNLTLFGYYAPNDKEYGISAKDNSGKYYLNQSDGFVYYSNGTSWSKINVKDVPNPLPLISTSIYSEITQTAEKIESEVADAKKGLESQIVQTADAIRLKVASSQSKYDTSGLDYTITLFGYYSPSDSTYGISASDNNGKYYLNQSNGYVYYSDGTKWSYKKTLKLITANLSSNIKQNADNIASLITKTDNQGTEFTSFTQSYNSFKSQVITTDKESGNFIGTQIEQNSEHVRLSWNKCSNYIQFENGAMNIYSSLSHSNNTLLARFDNNGVGFYYQGKYVGKIGTNKMQSDSTSRGLVFDLDGDEDDEGNDYMCWASKKKGDSTYTIKLAYYRKDDLLRADCPFEFKSKVQFDSDVTFNKGISAGNITGHIQRSQLADNCINTSELIDGAVTTDKIASGAVTWNKISGGLNCDITIGNYIYTFTNGLLTGRNAVPGLM